MIPLRNALTCKREGEYPTLNAPLCRHVEDNQTGGGDRLASERLGGQACWREAGGIGLLERGWGDRLAREKAGGTGLLVRGWGDRLASERLAGLQCVGEHRFDYPQCLHSGIYIERVA